MKATKRFDSSYNISEYEVDPSWKEYVSRAYREYRKKWAKASCGYLFNFPLCVEMESSYLCNLQCPKCPRQVLNTNNESGLFERKLYRKLLEEARKYRMPSIILDHEAEPLTNPFIADMVGEAKVSGILDIWMHTNANLLNEGLSRKIIKNGLTKINFSIDAATAQTYDKVRPGGNYKRVINNILFFLKVKKELKRKDLRARVSFVLQKENRHEAKDFFYFWKNKVNLICFQELIDFSKFNNRLKLSSKKLNGFACFKPWQIIIVKYNGDIVPCSMPFKSYPPEDYLLGNLHGSTIEQCWNSPKLDRIRRYILDKSYGKVPFCRDCIHAYTNIK